MLTFNKLATAMEILSQYDEAVKDKPITQAHDEVFIPGPIVGMKERDLREMYFLDFHYDEECESWSCFV